jgi:hypothetical protein
LKNNIKKKKKKKKQTQSGHIEDKVTKGTTEGNC